MPLLWPVVAAEAHFIQAIPFILPIAHIGMTGTVRGTEAGDPARLPAQVAGRMGLKK